MKKNIKIIFSVLLSCLAVFGIIAVFFAVKYPVRFKEIIRSESLNYDISQALIYSIINTESGFRPTASSVAGAVGLMQIMPSTANWIAGQLNEENYEPDQLLLAETNIRFGSYYLSYLFTKFSNENTVICAYNAGETTVRSWLNNPEYSGDGITLSNIPYRETAYYLTKVLRNKSVYTNLYGLV